MDKYENIYLYYDSIQNKLYIESLNNKLIAKILVLNNDDIINIFDISLNNNIYWIMPSKNLGEFDDIKIIIKDENSNIIKEQTIKVNKNVEPDNGNIKYVSGGLLGDFIYQLSVVKENYLLTGKKGDLYLLRISNIYPGELPRGTFETWRFGTVKTYNDIKNVVLSQNYISSFQIYNDEKFEKYIHLSSWRNSNLLTRASVYDIFKNEYNVDWGSHKWLDLPIIDFYKDVILFSSSGRKQNPFFDLKKLKDYNKKIFFATTSINEYNDFKKSNDCDFDLLLFNKLEDFWIAINSCYLFVAHFGSFMAVANALHKNTIALLPHYNDFKDDVIHFSKDIPNLRWYENDNKNNLY